MTALREVLARATPGGLSHTVAVELTNGETAKVGFRLATAKEAKELRADYGRMAALGKVDKDVAGLMEAFEHLNTVFEGWLEKLCPEVEDADMALALIAAVTNDGYQALINEGLMRCAGVRMPNRQEADSGAASESEQFPAPGA